jgi:hypothetical protein
MSYIVPLLNELPNSENNRAVFGINGVQIPKISMES